MLKPDIVSNIGSQLSQERQSQLGHSFYLVSTVDMCSDQLVVCGNICTCFYLEYSQPCVNNEWIWGKGLHSSTQATQLAGCAKYCTLGHVACSALLQDRHVIHLYLCDLTLYIVSE